ncbi:HAD-IIIC family phosphatase [Methylophilaceae bacterium]|nr:HAD-IIIC family phosphatase [Methylophilaceae bacterium]
MKRIILDLDNTLTLGNDSLPYDDLKPNVEIVKQLNVYKDKGFEIIIYTSRNMNTYKNSIGKINANTLPNIISWLNKNNIHFDEVYIGKPWCGDEGFYVDDKAIRPDEFINLEYEEIRNLTNSGK